MKSTRFRFVAAGLFPMIRSIFFAAGLYLVLTGSALFFIDEVTLTSPMSSRNSGLLDWLSSPTTLGRRALNPPEWLPFLGIGIGGVTMMYAIALPATGKASPRPGKS